MFSFEWVIAFASEGTGFLGCQISMNKVYLSFCSHPFEATRVRVNNSITFLSLMNSVSFSPLMAGGSSNLPIFSITHIDFSIYFIMFLFCIHLFLLSFWLFTSNHLLWAYLILHFSWYCSWVLKLKVFFLLCAFCSGNFLFVTSLLFLWHWCSVLVWFRV